MKEFSNLGHLTVDDREKADSYKSGSNLGAILANLKVDSIGCALRETVDLEKFVEACFLKSAKFETHKLEDDLVMPKTLHISSEKELRLRDVMIRCENVLYARRLTNTPPNLLRPSDMEREALELEKLGIKVSVLKGAAIEKMGCLIGVGQGSTDEPRLIVLQWMPTTGAAIGLVGKGVTFDTGGYSIKTPSTHMEEMKVDMSGAGVVMATIRAAAQLGLERNIVAAIPCVENMIAGNSYRPGDVLKSLSGKTVEVLNTDAEGRLILVDALTYIQDNFQLEYLIDLATLTGAMVVALGEITCGFFSNSDKLSQALMESSDHKAEPIWRMPLGEDYDKLIDSDIADVKNVSSGYGAGSITAAQFLHRFVKEDMPWAHLDIAGVAYTKSGSTFSGKYGSGFAVRLLLELVSKRLFSLCS